MQIYEHRLSLPWFTAVTDAPTLVCFRELNRGDACVESGRRFEDDVDNLVVGGALVCWLVPASACCYCNTCFDGCEHRDFDRLLWSCDRSRTCETSDTVKQQPAYWASSGCGRYRLVDREETSLKWTWCSMSARVYHP